MQLAAFSIPMTQIQRSALVARPASTMFALVNDVVAYPRRFQWCEAAQVLSQDEAVQVARLDLRAGCAPRSPRAISSFPMNASR